MRRAIGMGAAILGLSGCAQVESLGATLAAPPIEVWEAIKLALEWLAGLLGPFALSLVGL